MTSIVEHVFKNIRYKLLRVDGKYYILDMDRPVWSIIFPFLYWFMPHPVYQIDYHSYEKLKMPSKQQGSRAWMVVLAMGLTIFLSQLITSTVVPKLSNLDSSISLVLKIIVLLVAVAVIISIRGYLHRSRYKKIDSMVEVDQLDTNHIKIRPAKFTAYLQLFVGFFLFLAFSFFAGFAYIEYGNLFLLFFFIPMSLAFLVTNTLVIPIGFAKITFLNKNDQDT